MGATPDLLESLTQTVTQDVSFANDAVWQSLHSANPGSAGSHEITTGAGAEGRQAVDFSGAGGVDANTAQVQFLLAGGGQDVTWVGYWDEQEGGTFLGGFPLVGPQFGAAGSAGSNLILAPGNSFSVGQGVRLYVIPGVNSSIPLPLAEDTVYYVVASGPAVQLAATPTGSPIDPTQDGVFVACLDQSHTFVESGLLTFPSTTGITYETVS